MFNFCCYRHCRLEIQEHKNSLDSTILWGESWEGAEQNVIEIDQRYCHTFKTIDATIPQNIDAWRYIPPSMGCLDWLVSLDLSSIGLIGAIPASLRKLVCISV